MTRDVGTERANWIVLLDGPAASKLLPEQVLDCRGNPAGHHLELAHGRSSALYERVGWRVVEVPARSVGFALRPGTRLRVGEYRWRP